MNYPPMSANEARNELDRLDKGNYLNADDTTTRRALETIIYLTHHGAAA